MPIEFNMYDTKFKINEIHAKIDSIKPMLPTGCLHLTFKKLQVDDIFIDKSKVMLSFNNNKLNVHVENYDQAGAKSVMQINVGPDQNSIVQITHVDRDIVTMLMKKLYHSNSDYTKLLNDYHFDTISASYDNSKHYTSASLINAQTTKLLKGKKLFCPNYL